jgi:hypothetical protein
VRERERERERETERKRERAKERKRERRERERERERERARWMSLEARVQRDLFGCSSLRSGRLGQHIVVEVGARPL